MGAVATSGTAAHSGMASANVEQTVTLPGTGLLSTDQVVFTTLDANGNLSDHESHPTSVAANGTSLTVVVPDNATTGRVRLERDRWACYSQIVPTLTDVNLGASGFIGGTLTLRGSGFAEGATAVWLGGRGGRCLPRQRAGRQIRTTTRNRTFQRPGQRHRAQRCAQRPDPRQHRGRHQHRLRPEPGQHRHQRR